MAKLNAQALARLHGVLATHVERQRIPGAVALVASGGQVEFFEALGRRDPAAGTPMRTDSIFRIYSMTKPLVSLAALMLVEDGALQLAEPVSHYLPMFAGQQVAVEGGPTPGRVPAVRGATVQDLLRHTAGLSYEFLGDGPVQTQYAAADIASRARTNLEFCEVLAALPLAHQPGSCWEYSRATDVLGALLEVAGGQPLGELLRRRIFEPLGMADTGFSVPPEQWHRIAEPFALCPDSGEAVEMLNGHEVPRFESGGGGLLSTAPDYLRFLQLMRGRGSLGGQRLLSRKSIEWMTADHLGGLPVRGDLLARGHGFGLGFGVLLPGHGAGVQLGSPGLYYWSGVGGTSFFVDPAEDLFGMLLTQAPNQRVYFRNLFRNGVYAAVD